MTLPRDELLAGSCHRLVLAQLLDQAEEVLRTWQPSWSPFLSGPELEEAGKLKALSELRIVRNGGREGAERCRLQLSRLDKETDSESAPLSGLRLEGNFLFDRAEPEDMRQALMRLDVSADAIGDLWLRGDRGAQAVCKQDS